MRLIILLLITIFFSLICYAQQEIKDLSKFKKTDWTVLNENAIKIISKDWFLISAGSLDSGFNMMTASWGGMGYIYNKPVTFIFISPQRYTFQFTEREEYFVLTFYEEEYREILKKMGTVSGRDFDKINNSGLTPIKTENGSVGFKEARIIIECKKFYEAGLLKDGFKDQKLVEKKNNAELHKMYVGEIVNVWIKE